MTNLASSGAFGGNVNMFGVIKEVAPAVNAKTDEQLGVAEFQREYFPYPLYLDEEQGFYEALGSRQITKDLDGTWNILKWIEGFKQIGIRIKEKNIEGRAGGNGLVLGGIFVINPDENDENAIVYTYKEATGKEIPGKEIGDAVKAARKQNNFFTTFA